MNDYRVKVNSYVVVKARNQKDALAKAELALRKSVAWSYANSWPSDRFDESEFLPWGEPWERFGWEATGKPERIEQEPIE